MNINNQIVYLINHLKINNFLINYKIMKKFLKFLSKIKMKKIIIIKTLFNMIIIKNIISINHHIIYLMSNIKNKLHKITIKNHNLIINNMIIKKL